MAIRITACLAEFSSTTADVGSYPKSCTATILRPISTSISNNPYSSENAWTLSQTIIASGKGNFDSESMTVPLMV